MKSDGTHFPQVCLVALGLAACGGAPHGHHHGEMHAQHAFKSPEEWAKRFDDPARDAWQKPDAVLGHLKYSSNSKVADIGAGTGYFAVRIAPHVPVGKVYAIDVEPSMVEYTQKRAATMGLNNVVGVVAAPDDPRLPEPVEIVLVVDTYHHLADRAAYFRKVKDKLLPGGRVVIVDYKPDPEIPGPPQALRLPADTIVSEMAEAGYTVTTRSEGALPRQYLLIFEAR